MKNLIRIICETLNIKPSDTVIVARITEKLNNYSPELQVRFVAYCEKHFAEESVRFLSGYQKFLELAKRFEEGVIELRAKEALSDAEIRAKELVEKIKNTKSSVEKYVLRGVKLNFENFLESENGKKVFSTDDVTLLNRVQGDLSSCLHYIDAFGREELEAKIVAELSKSIRRINKNGLFLANRTSGNTLTSNKALKQNLGDLSQKVRA